MIRLDYLDDLVWRQILELLRSPELIRAEMERRRMESLSANPVQQRQEQLERQLSRAKQQMDKLLDAYQEDLLNLSDLRARAPALKKKIAALESERQNLGVRALEDQKCPAERKLWAGTWTVGFASIQTVCDASRRSGLQITHEDVGRTVVVVRDEVGRFA